MAASLDLETLQKLYPLPCYRAFIKEAAGEGGGGKRPNGRALAQHRGIQVDIVPGSGAQSTTTHGKALVRLGGTVVVAGVQAVLSQPDTSTPDQGMLVVNVELTTVSSPMVKPGPPSDKAQRLSARLDTLLKQSPELFKLEQLCIARGKACWCLYVDLVVTSDDAGLFDGSLVALFAALRAVRLPHVAYHPEEDVVRCVERAGETAESAGRSLQLTRCVIPVTFGVFGGSVVADPDLAETPLMDTLVTLVLSLPASSSQPMEAEDEVVYHLIHKPGHTPVGLAMMQRLMAMSVTHAQHVKPTLLHE